MDPFAPSSRSLRIDMAPPPETDFALRYDYAATREGMAGGLAIQSTEWHGLAAKSWEDAKAEARTLVHAINPCRFDRNAPQHLQGCCLVELKFRPERGFRTLSFRAITNR